ncbi:hypothetical protein AB0H12_20535 [Actinosynnema sp. NPDC023794]
MRIAAMSDAVVASLVVLPPTAPADPVAATDSVRPMGECSLGFLCGLARNDPPRSSTVKLAELGTGSERCVTDQGTFTCGTSWLPSDWTSRLTGAKDADALTVENAAWTYGPSTWFAAGAWQRISNVESRSCVMREEHPACYQN